jgi:hypothetical protein
MHRSDVATKASLDPLYHVVIEKTVLAHGGPKPSLATLEQVNNIIYLPPTKTHHAQWYERFNTVVKALANMATYRCNRVSLRKGAQTIVW